MLPMADVRVDERLPLICNRVPNIDSNSYEMVPVHTGKTTLKPSTNESSNSAQKRDGMQSDLTSRIILSVHDRVNVIEALHAFWQKKQVSDGVSTEISPSIVVYKSEPSVGSPSICYVTLPGGCCFANPRESATSAEARRCAAHVALVNSVYNELPSRRITKSFIASAVHEASLANASRLTGHQSKTELIRVRVLSKDALFFPLTSSITCGNSLDENAGASRDQSGVDAYQLALESTFGQTILDFTALVNKLRIMHWSGALSTMNADGASRQDVLRAASSEHWVSEDCRSEMALRWIAVERRHPGSIDSELKKANMELLAARRQGRELAFPRLKRDVLELAGSQVQSSISSS